ncbi:MAG: peptidoglycan-binding protein [Rhizobiaceae bacterium]
MTIILFITPAISQNYSTTIVKTVQKKLKDDGYDIDELTGKLDKSTIAAINMYQSDWQIPVTGEISYELMSRLQDRHNDTKMQMQQAENQPCFVFNPDPQARSTITFDGTCIAGRAEGRGRTHWKFMAQGKWQREKYDGMYKDGKMHGKGMLSWNNGSARYEGNFHNNLAHGLGELSTEIGWYHGEWLQGEMHGLGMFWWSNGGFYDGEWKNGKPHGRGTLVWNGKVYGGKYYQGCFRRNGVLLFTVFTTRSKCGW